MAKTQKQKIIQLTLFDTHGLLNHKVQSGIAAERFVFNLDEDEAADELRAVEKIEQNLQLHF